MKNKNTFIVAFLALALSVAACKQADVSPKNASEPEVTKVDSAYKPPRDPFW